MENETFEEYKEKVLGKLLKSDIDNKNELFGFYMRMQVIKEENMVSLLNQLDKLSEDCENKRLMRSMILNNYNDLPRKTLRFIEKLIT